MSGNEVRQTINFSVGTDVNSNLIKLLDEAYANNSIDNEGIYNSLRVKLVKGNLVPFIRQLYAQKGKHIKASTADKLIEGAWRQIKSCFQSKINEKEDKSSEEKELKNEKDKKEIKHKKDKKLDKSKKHKNKWK